MDVRSNVGIKKAEKVFCMVLAMLMAIVITINVSAGESISKAKIDEYLYTIAYSQQEQVKEPIYGSIDGEWNIIGLARYGAVTKDYISKYKENLLKEVKAKDGVLSTRKYTEYSRVVIALASIDENPTNFGGYNLLKPLAEFDNVNKQGINGSIYALIAIHSSNYKIPKPDKNYTGEVTTVKKLIEYIIKNQNSDGGWSMADKSECDITAMAVQALSFYYTGSDKSVKKSVDKALKFLSRQQNNDGGYSAEGISNCESTAQVLMAISALNINIEDSRFVKNGNTVLNGLLDYYSNGKFSHTKNGGYNHMATEQGFCALTAYYRSLTIMNGFYDMADGISYQKVSKKVLEKKKTAASKTKTTKTVKKTTKKSTKKSTKKNTSKNTVSDKDKEETTSVKNNKKSSSSNKKSNKNTKTKLTKNSKSKTNKKVKKSNKKEESETTVKNSKNNTSDDAKVGEKEAKINDVNGKKNQSNRTEIVIGVIAAVVMVIAIIVYIIGKRKAENEK